MLSQEQNKVDISFSEGLFFPFRSLYNNWSDFILLNSIVSLVMSVIILLTGQSLFCSFFPEIATYVFCSKAWWNVLIHYMSSFILLAFFINRWQVIFAKNMNFKDAIKMRMFNQDKKALLVVFIFFLLWLVVGMSIVCLQIRQPNPNWLIELGFFVLISLIIIFSVLLLFNFVIFQHFLQGGRFFALNKTFWPILDNIYKYMIWFLLYVLLFSYLFQTVFQIISWGKMFLLGRIFVMEFCLYFLIYTIAALFVASLDYQEKIFFDKK